MLSGSNVVLGITGSIAAYKAAFLCRLLVKSGANVKVIMTEASKEFISALTLSTLSKNPVYSEYSDPKTGTWNNHVEIAKWADILLIAPATTNSIAKMASGLCDNLLMAVYLSAECPVYVAPAMDLDMYRHPSYKKNIAKLKSYGNHVIPAESGELASGLKGEGRMCEPEKIMEVLKAMPAEFKGKKIVISAGPTQENIDPVRFIGNRSSGKMGYALAEEARKRGAEVVLVSGPVSIAPPRGVVCIPVNTAEEMHREMLKHSSDADIIIMSAAVADYRPSESKNTKIKKMHTELSLKLEPTKDILSDLGKKKAKGQILVGFALETDKEEENALKKLKDKKLDFIVLNSLKNKGAGFAYDTNKVSIYSKNNKAIHTELKSKKEIAMDILNEIVKV